MRLNDLKVPSTQPAHYILISLPTYLPPFLVSISKPLHCHLTIELLPKPILQIMAIPGNHVTLKAKNRAFIL